VIVAAAAVILLGIVGIPVTMDAFEPAGTKDLGSGSVPDPLRWFVNVPAGEVNEYSTDVPGLALGPLGGRRAGQGRPPEAVLGDARAAGHPPGHRHCHPQLAQA
jgi:hypothetical protein